MTSDLYDRWLTLVATLHAEADALEADPNQLLQRVRQLLLRCPINALEPELWALHDRLVLTQTARKEHADGH
jgi:hypothetical protein